MRGGPRGERPRSRRSSRRPKTAVRDEGGRNSNGMPLHPTGNGSPWRRGTPNISLPTVSVLCVIFT